MQAEYQLTPWGEEAAEFRNATVGLGIAKAALGNAVESTDFIPEFDGRGQTPADMRSVLQGMAKAQKDGKWQSPQA